MRVNKLRAVDENVLEDVIQNSFSVLEVFKKLKIKPSYSSFRTIVRERGYDVSHFKGQSHAQKGHPSTFLIRGRRVRASRLRWALIELGREYVCEGLDATECDIGDEWNNRPLTLQVDHIDGDEMNNTPDNLRFLCPNCHSQTLTFGYSKTSREIKFARENGFLYAKRGHEPVWCFPGKGIDASQFSGDERVWVIMNGLFAQIKS